MKYSEAQLGPRERLERSADFLTISDRDLQLVRQTAHLVRQHAGSIVKELYDNLTRFPESRELLDKSLAATGEGIERRREALTAWLGNVLTLIEEASDWLPDAVRSTGAVHAGSSKSSVQVPLDLMVMTMASLQNSINMLLVGVANASAETVAAWGKVLWLTFDMMAAAYDDELPAAADTT
ncbi:MAG TPA: protoglobin domain-containing protein [Dehalococcoidia bacterium]|nr:protoglobin domain-containing protein [Dehalococcoidia bacterium]